MTIFFSQCEDWTRMENGLMNVTTFDFKERMLIILLFKGVNPYFMNQNTKMMVGLREAAEYTGLTYNCIRRLCLKNEIVHIRSGKKFYVNLPKLLEYLNHGV